MIVIDITKTFPNCSFNQKCFLLSTWSHWGNLALVGIPNFKCFVELQEWLVSNVHYEKQNLYLESLG